MKPFFSDDTKVTRLKAALEARKGMPFRHGAGAIDSGFNCWHLLVSVFEECGLDVSSMYDFKARSLNHGRLHNESLILAYLHDDPLCRKHVKRQDEEEPVIAGDIIPIRETMSEHHLVVAESADIVWQIPRGGSVGQVSLRALRMMTKVQPQYRIFV